MTAPVKTTWSAARVAAGSGPHPVGPTITSGQGSGSEPRTWPNACTSRSRFLRGSSVPTVRRNSPPTRPARRRRVSAAGGIGGGQMIGAARHDRDAARRNAHRGQVGGHQPRRDDERGPGLAGALQRRLVPAHARAASSPRDSRRQATSCTVTTGRCPARTTEPGRGQRHRVHDVETRRARGTDRGPRPGSAAARAAATRRTGRPKATQRVVGAPRAPGWPAASPRPDHPPPSRRPARPGGRARRRRCRRAHAAGAARRPGAPSVDVGSATPVRRCRDRAPRGRRRSAPTCSGADQSVPAAMRRPRRASSSRPASSASTSPSWSPASTSRAPSPSTSGNEPARVATTGTPARMACSGGNPNPS